LLSSTKSGGRDYYGGDRTADVHIKTLRGAIEDPTHALIETLRNMGYSHGKTSSYVLHLIRRLHYSHRRTMLLSTNVRLHLYLHAILGESDAIGL
jgi:hypothetical protein